MCNIYFCGIMKKDRREVDLVVLSDIHLGTYGCQAKEVLRYLKSIKPKRLILNGDIFDIWQFKKRYWPSSHMKVVKQIISLAAEGVDTYYITGNHDEIFRKFSGLVLGKFHVVNEVQMDLAGGKAWFFHGDVFDMIIQNSKWLAKLGSIGYDILILANSIINYFARKFNRPKVSMSKKIKDNVKSAVKYITNFEDTAARIGYKRGFSYVVCGHIHKSQHRTVKVETGEIVYLNSGDWVENLTALEYDKGEWSVYEYKNDFAIHKGSPVENDKELAIVDLKPDVLLKKMFVEFNKNSTL